MTIARARFTIDTTPDRNGWLPVTFHDGRKLTGAGRVRSHVDLDVHPSNRDMPPAHVILLDLSPTLDDENGHTVYRDADPAADEVDSWSAVIRHPVRVNGIPYSGTMYVERGFDPETGKYVNAGSKWYPGRWSWRVSQAHVERIPHLGNNSVTDAARKTLYAIAHEVAATLAGRDRLHRDRIADARRVMDRALDEVSKANREYLAAAAAYDTLTIPADKAPTYPADVLSDQIDVDLTNHATGQRF